MRERAAVPDKDLSERSGTARRTSLEQMDELRRPEANTRLMYKIVCLVSGLTVLSAVAYGLASSVLYDGGSFSAIGESMVAVTFPLPYFAQPVTYLSLASVTFFYTALRLRQSKVAQWSHLRLASLQLVAIVLAFGSAYAVLYNFMLWGSYSSAQILYQSVAASASLLSAPATAPWTMDFVTKIFAAVFVISGYSVYFLRKVHQVRGLPDGL